MASPARAADDLTADPARAGRGWFAFLGGAVAWTFHLILVWAIAEFGCVSGFGDWAILGVGGLAWLVIAVSIGTFLVAAAASVIGYVELRDRGDLLDTPPQDTSGANYLARAGAVLSAVLAAVIAVESVPILFFLEGCR